MRLLFGISCLGLKLYILSLGDHIPDYEIVLKVFGLSMWLNLLIHSNHYWDFSIKRRGLDGRVLLRKMERINNRRRERHWNFSNVLREENVLNTPQFGVSKDSCPVERFCPHLSTVVPAHSYHLFCQPGLHFQHPTFIGCCLCGLRSFPGHPSCILSFLSQP